MISDLPSEFGPLDPGLSQLIQTLTGAPSAEELASEQAALTMFRANIGPAAPSAPSAGDLGTIPIRADDQTTVDRLGHARRLFRVPTRWGLRIVAAAAVLGVGGTTAAAYAAALPAPIQHLAYQAFGFAGVPDTQQNQPGPAPTTSGRAQPPAKHHKPGSGRSPAPRSSASSSPSRSGSPSSPSAAGPGVLTAAAVSSQITAGATATIDGTLTRSGSGVSGSTVVLLERVAGRPFWHVAGVQKTDSSGNVAITVSAVTTNAAFRLVASGHVRSPIVTVVVSPPITAVLTLGSGGVQDLLTVSTRYAHRGNVVVLQVQSASGSWASVKVHLLNAVGRTSFLIKAWALSNKDVRVVLLATSRHASSVSNTVLIPAPS